MAYNTIVYAGASSNDSKNIRYNEDIEKFNTLNDVRLKDTQEALEIVKNYIKEKGLILVGGQALDYAFKLRKTQLYDDWELPDYDFYSYQHHTDAYNLGKLLCDKGFSDISVINGRHMTTMRVRIQFVVVADITYCPKSIFTELNTLDYEGLRIIDPHYQRLDLFLSLARPFQNPPMEVIQHRYEKDLKRMIKLDEVYPISEVTDKIDSRVKNNIKHSKKTLSNDYISKYNKKYVYTGVNGFNIYREAFIKEYKERFSFEIPDVKSEKISIVMMLEGIKDIFNELKPQKAIKYKPYLDKRSVYYEFDSKDSKYEIYQDEENITHIEINGLKVVNIFHLMFYFMFRFIIHKENSSLILFDSLLCMAQYASVHRSKISHIFTISTNITDYSPDNLEILNKDKMEKIINSQQPIRYQPKNYYPDKDSGCKSVRAEQQLFDTTGNKYFEIDGESTEYKYTEGGYVGGEPDIEGSIDMLTASGVIGCIDSESSLRPTLGGDVSYDDLLSVGDFGCIKI